MTTRKDISAIINLHNEGLIAHNSLRSLCDAAAVARASGISVEILVVADRVDSPTKEYVAMVNHMEANVIEVDHGDLSSARNAGVKLSTGQNISFLDGDDLCSDNWLIKAYETRQKKGPLSILHPEANLFFGPEVTPSWMLHQDSTSHEGDWTLLALRNCWTSLSFADRSAYERVNFKRNCIGLGFGFEDWCWNIETIANGYSHQIVLGTTHLIRVQENSLVRQTSSARALMTPVELFRTHLGRRSGQFLRRPYKSELSR